MRFASWIDPHTFLLGSGFPLPLDIPFTGGMAQHVGIRRDKLAELESEGLLRRVFEGVYAAVQAPDTMRARAAALRLLISPETVVTDRTAAWLHGVDILHRGAHLSPPPLDTGTKTDTRVRRTGVDGHRRDLLDSDVTEIRGVQVTTLLRTACDLGRLLWRYDALAALDGCLRAGVEHEVLLAESERFKGYRGMRQLRTLAPLSDARAESPGESALRLHWYDAGLPAPELQFEVHDDAGFVKYRLDVPAPEVRYAAEYDGFRYHSDPHARARDLARRTWLRQERRWNVDVFTKHDVYRPKTDIVDRLKAGFDRSRRTMTAWRP